MSIINVPLAAGRSTYRTCNLNGLQYTLFPGGDSCILQGVDASYFSDNKIKHLVIPELISVDSVKYRITSCYFQFDSIVDIVSLPKYVNDILIQRSNLKKIDLSLCEGFQKSGVRRGSIKECQELESIILPLHQKKLRLSAIDNCKRLKSIKLPYSLEEMELYSFNGCENLSNLYIPENVKKIHSLICYPWYRSLAQVEQDFAKYRLFYNSIEVDAKNKYYSSENGVLFNKDKTDLILYPAGKPDSFYIVPSSVKRIRPMAFSHAKNLRRIYLSDSVCHVGNRAFVSCPSLDSIRFPNRFIYVDDYSMPENLKHIYLNGNVSFCRENPVSFLHFPDGRVVPSNEWMNLRPQGMECLESLPCDSIFNLLKGITNILGDAKLGKKCNYMVEDSSFWRIVKRGKTVIPCLISLIGDTTQVCLTVHSLDGKESPQKMTVSDVAISVLWGIISEFNFILQEAHKLITEEDSTNLKRIYGKYQLFLLEWYEKNKDNLTWVHDLEEHRMKGKEGIKYQVNPAGGYYELYKK